MTDFLCKRFVKNHENTKEPQVREGYGKLASVVGIISNTIQMGSIIWQMLPPLSSL